MAKRMEKKNDKDLLSLHEAKKKHHLRKWLGKWRAEWYWHYLLTHVNTSWGYRWAFTHFVNEAYCVVPPVNLVENIGMTDIHATHTSSNPYDLSCVTRGWRVAGHIPNIVANGELDAWIEDNIFSRSFIQRVKWICAKVR